MTSGINLRNKNCADTRPLKLMEEYWGARLKLKRKTTTYNQNTACIYELNQKCPYYTVAQTNLLYRANRITSGSCLAPVCQLDTSVSFQKRLGLVHILSHQVLLPTLPHIFL